MSLQACADIVAKGDPDRFAAAMAAPVEARKILFPLYAFNVEVTRAAWVTSESMIGEMRLQWWRDALEEMTRGGPVRRHEVTNSLSGLLMVDETGAGLLDQLILARRWDLYTDAFEDAAHFDTYLTRTGGILMWTCTRLLGAQPRAEPEITAFGRATALARFLAAVSALESRGRIPLVDGRTEAVKELCTQALAAVPGMAALKQIVPRDARPALLEGWQTVPAAAACAEDPAPCGGR